MKYSQWIGIVAAALLVAACFLPWAFYPDLGESFTGFYSHNNDYGKPGKLLTIFAVVASVFFAIPRVWAKRWNLLIGALTVAYGVRAFIVFSSCYSGICPTKQSGLWMMMGAALLVLAMALLPDLKVIEKRDDQ